MKRYLLMGLGFVSFGLGMVGVFVPVLPTTPLLLLAAFLFSRSSARMDAWIKSTRVWKSYGQPFKDSSGIARRKKIISWECRTLRWARARFWCRSPSSGASSPPWRCSSPG